MEPDDATRWLYRNVYGSITPNQLNDDRIDELNAMDYMQNSSIFYNSETILEMQILSCIIILNIHHLFENSNNNDKKVGGDIVNK